LAGKLQGIENTGNGVARSMAAQRDGGGKADPGFVTLRSGACKLRVRADLRQSDLLRVLPEGETELAQRYTLERVGSAPSSLVFRFVLSLEGTDHVLYYKEYVDRSLWDTLKHVVRASRARRAFDASMMLLANGISAPDILALGEVRQALLCKRCFLVTFAVMASQPVYVLLGDDSSELETAALRCKRDLLRTLGHTIGRMHARGIVHGDLRPGNILGRCDEGQWQLFFLDNERTRRWPWVPGRLRRKNLVQVGMVATGVSRTDRFRFWQAYLAECPELRRRAKHWARQVHARTMVRLAKY
jgi:hypothetical protein